MFQHDGYNKYYLKQLVITRRDEISAHPKGDHRKPNNLLGIFMFLATFGVELPNLEQKYASHACKDKSVLTTYR